MAGFWRKCRIGFRWFRLTVWLMVLAVVCALAWFDKVGLPDFLKTRLVATVREHGVQLDFTRLRLRLLRGLVAENVQARQAEVVGGPAVSIREIQLHLDWAAMLHGQLQVSGLELRHGGFTWTPTPATGLAVTNIEFNLQFGEADTWTLEHCSATVNGVRVEASGEIHQATELRHWTWFQGGGNGPISPALLARVDQLSAALGKIELATPPEVKLTVQGDAQMVSSFDLRLAVKVPSAVTPWGSFQTVALTAEARLAELDQWPQMNVRLATEQARTPWGQLTQAVLTAATEAVPFRTLPPVTLHCESAQITTAAARVRHLQWDAQLTTTTNQPAGPTAMLGLWSALAPYQLFWQAQAEALATAELSAGKLSVGGSWRFPELVVNPLTARLGGGNLNATATLNVATREVQFTSDSDFDLHAINPLLTPKTQTRLAAITWTQPPTLRGTGRLTLPPWNQPATGWQTGIEPTVSVTGELAFTNALAGRVPLDLVQSHFTYENQAWRLPDLKVVSARSQFSLDLAEDDHTKQFTCTLAGRFDPDSLRSLLPATNAARALAICELTTPLALTVAVQGNLYDPATLSAAGQLAITNFAVRGQWVDSVTSGFQYTNRTAVFIHPHLLRAGGTQMLTADGIGLDFKTRHLSFTNGLSTTEPQVVTRAIGPKTARTVEPYHFLSPPYARVNGYLVLPNPKENTEVNDADLTFEILQPAPFRWAKLNSPQLTGTIHWLGKILILTNISAQFYGGDSHGWAYFDFRPVQHDADYHFYCTVTNANLHLLAMDFNSLTNQLEGRFSGFLNVTNANTDSLQTWNGNGQVDLRDGLIWDIPVFGIISPVLNSVSPGLGNNRATEAGADFAITNGVFNTGSLMIRTTMSRLEYRGTVDMKQQVDARVTLELLRNTPLFGPVISTVLRPVSKVFEYRVTGSMTNPHTTPVYVPEFLLLPFHPFRTIEDLFTPANSGTKASTR